MGILVYAVARTGGIDAAALPSGCGGLPVSVVCTERLSAIISDEPSVALTEADTIAHDAVVRAAHLQSTVLPLRAGTLFEHDAMLSRTMRHASIRLLEDLERFHGCCEIALRVARSPRVVVRALQRARVAAGAESWASMAADWDAPHEHEGFDLERLCADELGDLRALSDRCRVEPGGRNEETGVLRYLVKQTDAETFVRTAELLRRSCDLETSISEPMPCFGFATRLLTA